MLIGIGCAVRMGDDDNGVGLARFGQAIGKPESNAENGTKWQKINQAKTSKVAFRIVPFEISCLCFALHPCRNIGNHFRR